MFCNCCRYDERQLEACRSWWHHLRGIRGKWNLDPAVSNTEATDGSGYFRAVFDKLEVLSCVTILAVICSDVVFPFNILFSVLWEAKAKFQVLKTTT